MEIETIFNILLLKLKEKTYFDIQDVEKICSEILEDYIRDEKRRNKLLVEFNKVLAEIEDILNYNILVDKDLKFKIDTYLLIMEIFASKVKDSELRRKILRIIMLKNRRKNF